MKFGLRKTSFNSHLSSKMDARSPRLEGVISSDIEGSPNPPALHSNGEKVPPEGLVFPLQNIEDSMIKSV